MICGNCTECCKLLPIDDPELKKAQGTDCVHCNHGCTIYGTKPESCTGFNCVYIESSGPLKTRPDKTHVIFERLYEKIYLGLVDNQFPEAWKNIVVQNYVDELNKDGISVIMSSFDSKMVMIKPAPKHIATEVYQLAQEALNGRP